MHALLKEIQFNSGTSAALVTAEEMKKAHRSIAYSVAILWLISIKQSKHRTHTPDSVCVCTTHMACIDM